MRADQGPADPAAQRRAHAGASRARWARRALPPLVLLVLLATFLPGRVGTGLSLAGPVLLLGAVVVVGVVPRRARVAQAVAGLPVPIEITKELATAMRSVGAMTRGIAAQRWWRRSRAAAEGMVLPRRRSRTADELRAAWLRDDIGAWHEHARTLAAAGPRAERVRTDVEGGR